MHKLVWELLSSDCGCWLCSYKLSNHTQIFYLIWRLIACTTRFRTCPVRLCSNISATPIGQMGLKMGWFPLGNGGCLIMNKVPSDGPIWQLKKRELLLPLSFLITKPIKLDLSNLHYGPHYEPHYRTQGCVIRENNMTTPLQTPLRTPLRTL